MYICFGDIAVTNTINAMTAFQFLLNKKESGELSILLQIGLPTHLVSWMEYYDYWQKHPDESRVEISHHFHVTKSTIDRAIHWMHRQLV